MANQIFMHDGSLLPGPGILEQADTPHVARNMSAPWAALSSDSEDNLLGPDQFFLNLGLTDLILDFCQLPFSSRESPDRALSRPTGSAIQFQPAPRRANGGFVVFD